MFEDSCGTVILRLKARGNEMVSSAKGSRVSCCLIGTEPGNFWREIQVWFGRSQMLIPLFGALAYVLLSRIDVG